MSKLEEPMTYPTVRCVMQYMEANKRIQITLRCPILRSMNRAVPLFIDYLFLGISRIIINTDLYQLGVYRHSTSTPRIEQFEKDNEAGGICYDLNEYGEKDTALDKVIGPGEVYVPSSEPATEMTPEEEDEYIERLMERLVHLKSLKRIKERRQEIVMIESRISIYRQKKQPAGPLPYTPYLQFTHLKSDGEEVIERMDYKRKMYEGMRYLCNMIFGGRKRPIKIRNLKITSTGGVLRLPPNIRFRFSELFMGSNVDEVMKSIEPLIDDCAKIDDIGIFDGHNLAMNYQHPVIKAAKAFIINRTSMTGQLFHVVLNNTNARFDVQNGLSTVEELISVIDKMQRDKRQIGTVYSFGIHSKETVKGVLRVVKEKPDCKAMKLANRGSARFPHCYCFRLTRYTVLTVCCNKNERFNDQKNGQEPWIMWIRVEWYLGIMKQQFNI